MKRVASLALAVGLGFAMGAGQAGAIVADASLGAAAANAKQTAAVTKVWWRGGPGWRPGYGWRPGFGWVPFAALGAALAVTGAYYYATGPYGPYYYGPRPYPCGGAPCEPPPQPLK